MPCVCGQKVERPQPKVQCNGCQEFFHLDCVGLMQADVDFLRSSEKPFFCNTCSADRRSSIRSQTLSVVPSEEEKNRECESNVHNNKQQITLLVVVKEIAALRTENRRILSAVNALHEEKNQLLQKSDDLIVEIRSLHSKLEAKDAALSTLILEVKNLKSIVANSANILASANTTNHVSTSLSPLSVCCPPVNNDNSVLNSAAASKTALQTSAMHSPAVAKLTKAKQLPKSAAATTTAPVSVTFASVAASTSLTSQVSATAASNAVKVSMPAKRQASQWETVTRGNRKKLNKPIVIGSSTIMSYKWSQYSNGYTCHHSRPVLMKLIS